MTKKLNPFNQLKNIKPENDILGQVPSSSWFSKIYKESARYVVEKKLWYCYDGVRWVPDSDSLITMEFAAELGLSLMKYSAQFERDANMRPFLKEVKKWQNHNYLSAVISGARGDCKISIKDFDRNTNLVNTENGTYDLENKIFRDHNPDDFITKKANFKYNKNIKSVDFDKFLTDITNNDEAMQLFLQEMVGYSLSGDRYLDKLFILYGQKSRNGKSTFIQCLEETFGDYVVTAYTETIFNNKLARSSQIASEDIALLKGARLITVSESEKRQVLNSSLVKKLTGRDKIVCRRLYENSIEFRIEGAIFLYTNHLPIIDDYAVIASKRLIVVPFDKTFDENEQDTKLLTKLLSPDVLSGIFNWALEGYYRLNERRKLLLPDKVNEECRKLDSIGCFVDKCLCCSEGTRIRIKELYNTYKTWCQEEALDNFDYDTFRNCLKAFGKVGQNRPSGGGEKTTVLEDYKCLYES